MGWSARCHEGARLRQVRSRAARTLAVFVLPLAIAKRVLWLVVALVLGVLFLPVKLIARIAGRATTLVAGKG